jgi:cell division protein FtsI (penicillin-binding protein 3)
MISFGQRFIGKRQQVEGLKKQALDTGRSRLLVAGMVMSMAFVGVAGRLVDLAVFEGGYEPRGTHAATSGVSTSGRNSIVDRNGMILATSLPTVSVFADPVSVLDPKEAATKLAEALPELSRDTMLSRLTGSGRFIWLARNLTPKQHYRVNRLGLPGIAFQNGERRVYPHGPLVSHILGLTDVDGNGVAGVESRFDQVLRAAEHPLRLSIDLRVQSVLHDELVAAMTEFQAIGATGVVMDVNTGELVAMVSLPDYDPNDPAAMTADAAFNRAAKGVYEMGSTFKLFTAAMALDSGTVSVTGGYDASQPIHIARFTISDYHAKNRWLSVPEIILHSSNIGAAKMAVDVGSKGQQDYLERFGLLKPAALELPEVGAPLVPSVWRPINTMTISYGHGISVSPVQLAAGVAALVNGGLYRQPTILKADGKGVHPAKRVISEETSKQMRGLMRLVVTQGTGKKADVRGYLVGGKTGTAEKSSRRGYSKSAKLSSFVGAFPMDAPRYVVLAMLDEPVGNKRTFNYATGGWVAAPVVGNVISRIAPMVGILPEPGIEIATPEIPEDKGKAAPRQPDRQAVTRQAVYRPDAGRWADDVARAVGMLPVRQTATEADVVLKTRNALSRAVVARERHRQMLSTAVSLMEQDVAAR